MGTILKYGVIFTTKGRMPGHVNTWKIFNFRAPFRHIQRLPPFVTLIAI